MAKDIKMKINKNKTPFGDFHMLWFGELVVSTTTTIPFISLFCEGEGEEEGEVALSIKSRHCCSVISLFIWTA